MEKNTIERPKTHENKVNRAIGALYNIKSEPSNLADQHPISNWQIAIGRDHRHDIIALYTHIAITISGVNQEC